MPTDTKAAFALDIKSLIDSGFSVEHPGGTTGRESCHPEREVEKSNKVYDKIQTILKHVYSDKQMKQQEPAPRFLDTSPSTPFSHKHCHNYMHLKKVLPCKMKQVNKEPRLH